MGKILYIKGADFSANAIGSVTPSPTPDPPTPEEKPTITIGYIETTALNNILFSNGEIGSVTITTTRKPFVATYEVSGSGKVYVSGSNGMVASNATPLCATYDADGNLINAINVSDTDVENVTDYEITIGSNVKYIKVNSFYGYATSVHNDTTLDAEVYTAADFVAGNFWNDESDTITNGTASSYSKLNEVSVGSNDIILVNVYGGTSTKTSSIIFVDDAYNKISSCDQGIAKSFVYYGTPPSGATKMLLTIYGKPSDAAGRANVKIIRGQ